MRHIGGLRAFVATADLGVDARSIVAPALEGRRIRSARLELEVEATSLTNGFTTTDCAELRLVENRLGPNGRRLERMAQYQNGIELVGWAHEDHPADAEHWFFTKAACERDATYENASLLTSRRKQLRVAMRSCLDDRAPLREREELRGDARQCTGR